MSGIYIQEPPTTGKVVLVTSKGDVEIELWCKECPKTCRNFIGLGMEGYYEGTTFHRIVPGFIVQGGDPTGTGHGGESIYGRPFKDEFHQRLRYNRRGLVGMANSGPNDNGSQFFITLDRADELDGKNAMFGKVVGDTFFNVLKMTEVALDANERPEDPIVIKRMDIILNPFEDLAPRPEVIAQKEALKRAEEERQQRKAAGRVKAVKNFSLVSFGDEAEEDEAATVTRKGIKSSHAVLKNDPHLKDHADSEDDVPAQSHTPKSSAVPAKRKAGAGEDVVVVVPTVVEGDAEAMEFDMQMREQLLRQRPGYVGSGASEGASKVRNKAEQTTTEADQLAAAKAEEARLREELRAAKDAKKAKADEAAAVNETEASAFLSDQRARYVSRGRGGSKDKAVKARREEETMALLNKFKAKLSTAQPTNAAEEPPVPVVGSNDPTDLDDIDTLLGDDWMAHSFSNQAYQRPKGIDPAKDPNSLDISDPRHPLNVRRREANRKEKDRERRHHHHKD